METERATHHGGATSQPAAAVQNQLFPSIPSEDFDLVTFIAIVQSIPGARILPLTPRFRAKNAQAGSSGQVCLPRKKIKKKGVAFKRFLNLPPHKAFEVAACEVVALEHPVFRDHPNIVRLLGVTFDLRVKNQVWPCLALEHSKYGALSNFLSKEVSVSVYQRLMFCFDVGNAIYALHKCNVVHGDIKFDNVLVFPHSHKDNTFVAKIIDFGASCFGSAEHDTVALAFTQDWKAPEIKYPGQQFQLEDAKRTDIFSYGLLCKKLLEFSESQDHEYTDDSEQALIHDYQQALDIFFERSCNDTPERREDIEKLLSRLNGVISWYEKTTEGRNERSNMGKAATLDLTRRLRSFDPRALIGRMLGIVMSDKTSEFYVRGQVQVRMLQRRVKRAVPITLISLFLVSLAMVISVSAIRSAIGPRRQSQGAAAIIALSVFGAGVFFLAWWIIYYISTTQGWVDPRVVLQLAAVYGQRKHVIPYLPSLAPVLNEMHHFVRQEIVSCLQKRVDSGFDKHRCDDCCKLAHVELAWANQAAFGTAQNVEQAKSLILKGGRSERYLRQLRSEANFWDFGLEFDTRYGLDREWEAFKYDRRTDREVSSTYGAEDLETAVTALRAELEGKKNPSMTIYSQMSLAFTLASLYRKFGDLGEAEYFYRTITVLKQEANDRAKRVAPFLRLFYDPYLFDLVDVLSDQGKIKAAIRELETKTSAAQSPNGRKPLWNQVLTISWRYNARRSIAARLALVELYVQQRDISALNRMNLQNDMMDLRTRKSVSAKTKSKSFRLIGEYAQLLSKKGEFETASRILEERMVYRDHMILDSLGRFQDRRKDAIIFSQSNSHLQAAIDIQKELLATALSTKLSNHEIVALRMEHAFSLTRFGKVTAALETVRELSDFNAAAPDPGPFTWNCLRSIIGSICSHNPGDLGTQRMLQEQLLKECETTEDEKLKTELLLILCSTGRQDGRETAIQRLQGLLSHMTPPSFGPPHMGHLVQRMLIFMLSCRGLAHEIRDDLVEACGIAEHMLNNFSTRAGKSRIEVDEGRASAYQIASLAYRNKLIYLCRYGGFNQEDIAFSGRAISHHKETAELMGNIYGHSHPYTEYAYEQLANMLSEYGRTVQSRSHLAQAQELFTSLLKAKTRQDEESTHMDEPICKIPLEVTAARLTRLRLENGETTMKDSCIANEMVRKLYETSWRSGHPALLAIYLEHPSLDKAGGPGEDYADEVYAAIEDLASSRKDLSKNPKHHPDIFNAWVMLSGPGAANPKISRLRKTVNAATLLYLHDREFKNPATFRYRSILANALSKYESTRLAGIELCKSVLEFERVCFGELHTRTISTQRRLAKMHLQVGAQDDAKPLLQIALPNAIKLLGCTHTDTIQIYEYYLEVFVQPNVAEDQEIRRFLLENVRPQVPNNKFEELSRRLKTMIQPVQAGSDQQLLSTIMPEIMESLLQKDYGVEKEDASEICKGLQAAANAANV